MVAVYGASGRTGQAVVRALRDGGVDVMPVGRRPPQTARGPWRTADTSPGQLHRAFSDCGAVVQCASLDDERSSAVAAAAVETGAAYVDVCADARTQRTLRSALDARARAASVPLCVGAAPIGGALGEWLAVEVARRGASRRPGHVRVAYASRGLPTSSGSLKSSLRMLLRERSRDTEVVEFPPPFGAQHTFSFPLGFGALDRVFPGASVRTTASMQLGVVDSSAVAAVVQLLRRIPPGAPPELLDKAAEALASLAGDRLESLGSLSFSVVATVGTHSSALIGKSPYAMTAVIAAMVVSSLGKTNEGGVLGVSEVVPAAAALSRLRRQGFIRVFHRAEDDP